VRDVDGRSLGQSDVGIAAKRRESATHSFGARKGGVEHWNAINATICKPSVCKLRINATQREDLVGSFYT